MVNYAARIYSIGWNFRIKREIYLETMKQIIIVVFLYTKLIGQNYSIRVFGIHACDVIQTISSSDKIEFRTQNRGLFDIIWPANNYYEATFNQKDFSLKKWSKKINQGDYKKTLSAVIDTSGTIEYNNKNKIKLSNPIFNIFTMLAMVQSYDKDLLDTKWFNYEHDGRFGKARFLWSDSSNVWDGHDSILTDHYRLDIVISDSSQSIESRDYFMSNIANDNSIKELWVSRKNKRKIIAASIKMKYFYIKAQIVRNKEV